MSKILLRLSIVAAIGLLVTSYGFDKNLILTLILIIYGAIWLVGEWRSWTWTAFAGLLLITIAAAFGIWNHFAPLAMIVAGVIGIMAWNLSQHCRHLDRAAESDDIQSIERRHLIYLLGFGLLAIGISSASLLVQIRLTLTQAILLVFIATLSLGQLIRWLRETKSRPAVDAQK
jgi:hypothetical protein